MVAQMVKHLPTTQETQVQSLGREDLLEKEMATHSSILAWNIPWMEEPGGLQPRGSQRQTWLSDFTPYGVEGETDYTAQEDLKSINSYNLGEGRTIRVWFLCSCIPRPSLVLSALSSLGHHNNIF